MTNPCKEIPLPTVDRTQTQDREKDLLAEIGRLSLQLRAVEFQAHTLQAQLSDLEAGGLYEVWLSLEERPKPAVAIRYLENIDIWEVLVDGQVITQDTRRIFRTGTAKPSPSALAEIQQMIADKVRHMEDQKILKFLSETT